MNLSAASSRLLDQREALPEIVKSEVNLLLLPFFALSRKGLRRRTSIAYRDKIIRDGKQLEIFWQVTANTKLWLSGPLR